MPIHDWSHVEAGIVHDFHQSWTIEICHELNGGGLPDGFFAMVEQVVSRPISNFASLPRSHSTAKRGREDGGGIAVEEAPPKARFVTSIEDAAYVGRANQIAIRHRLGKVVAVIEIVSPGNKGSQHALRAFAEKAAELLRGGTNLLVVDLFPPSRRDPQGIHQVILEQLSDQPFHPAPDKPLTVAAYSAGERITAYVDPVAVGDTLPAPPIFLDRGTYVPAPLESTYQLTWSKCPSPLREAVENPPTI